jgi:N-acetylmuramoyl-L-alanine amidase
MKVLFFILLFITLSYADSNAYIIAIDMGHTEMSPGPSSSTGVTEMTYNKRIGHEVKRKLETYGIDCIAIENMDIHQRPFYANTHANVLISFHHDSSSGKKAYRIHGFGIFVSQKNPKYKEGLKLAKLIGAEMVKNDFIVALYHKNNKSRQYKLVDEKDGIYTTPKLFLLVNTKIPSILIECGVLSNRGEEEYLRSDDGLETLSNAVVNGVLKYIRL